MKLRLAMIMLLVVLWAGPAFAQGCAMCYSNASGTTKEGQRAISRGVVVLLVPPVGFMTLGVGMALRYGKRRDEEKQESTNRTPRTSNLFVVGQSPRLSSQVQSL